MAKKLIVVLFCGFCIAWMVKSVVQALQPEKPERPAPVPRRTRAVTTMPASTSNPYSYPYRSRPPATIPSVDFATVQPEVTRFSLANGMNVSIIRIEGERLFIVHTVLPRGFAYESPGRLIWIRMVERLVTQSSPEYDGYTGVSHVRLSTWSRANQWRETLQSHARLLDGAEFTQREVDVYREDTFANLRGWIDAIPFREVGSGLFAQGYLYSQKMVRVNERLASLSLADLQRYRDAQWHSTRGANLCIVTDQTPEVLRPEIEAMFSGIGPVEDPPAPAHPPVRSLRITYDGVLPFVVLAWPMTDTSPKARAALEIFEHLLNERDWDVNISGMVCTANCPRWPGGHMFLLTVRTEPGGSLDDIVDEARNEVARLTSMAGLPKKYQETRDRLAENFALAKLPTFASDEHFMLTPSFQTEQDWALWWSQIEYRYGDAREAIGQALKSMKPEEFTTTARRLLHPRECITCLIVPGPKGAATKPAS